MVDPDAPPYEVGRGRPPRQNQFKPGNVPKGHRRKGRLGLLRQLQHQLEEPVPGKDRTFAEVLVQRIVAEALRNPVKCWPILKALVDREPGLGEEPEDPGSPLPEGAADGAVEDEAEEQAQS